MSDQVRNLLVVLLVMLSIPVGAVIGGRMALNEHEVPEEGRGVLMEVYWHAFVIGEGIRCAGPDIRGCAGPP